MCVSSLGTDGCRHRVDALPRSRGGEGEPSNTRAICTAFSLPGREQLYDVLPAIRITASAKQC